MNKNMFKVIFSKSRGDFIVVSEYSECAGAGGHVSRAAVARFDRLVCQFVGMVSLSALTVSMAWAAPASNALPSGGVVSYGQASISQSGSTLTINQSSNKAIANWQSFDIGAAARVSVNQPGSNAVLLNRVVGNSPSQIFGKLDANGQVILVNPNGVLFGKGGSVNTGGFTASAYSLSDADFIAGNYRYYRNGSTASVINEGSISVADGSYVALIGAAVSNSGQIVVPHGTVGMAAGEVVNVPLSASGKITFELTPASINTSVSNTAGGIIQATDGQVYMRAASLNGALASILQAGSIDVSGNNGGQVQLLADHGQIRVSGAISADGIAGKQGSIIIGRDPDSGVLAASTDVSGAALHARNGFIETSAEYLKTDGVDVQAKSWLLDPADVTITNSTDSNYTVSGGIYSPNSGVNSSVVNVATIDAALNNGTDVSITTTNSGTAGSSNGNIYVQSAIQKTAGSDATLTLTADNNLQINAAITSSSGKLNLLATGNGSVAGSQGVTVSGTTINTNGGDITLNGTATGNYGVYLAQGSAVTGGNVTLNGTGNGSGVGILIDRNVAVTAGSALTLNGTNTGTGNAVILGSNPSTTAIQLTSGTTASINGSATNTASTSDVLSLSDFTVNAAGDIKIAATTANSAATGVRIYKSLSSGNSIASTGGDVKVTSTQGGIIINGAAGSTGISGKNVTIDNTGGATVSGTTVTQGGGTSTATSTAGVVVNVGVQATSGNILIAGNGSGGGVNVGSMLTANTSSSQAVLVSGKTSTDTVTNYGVQFGAASGINAGSYAVNGNSSATGNQNGSAGVYLSGTFVAQQDSSVTGNSSNAAGQSAGVVMGMNTGGSSTLSLSQTSGALTITGQNSFAGSLALNNAYSVLDMSGVSSYGTTSITAGTVKVTGTGSSGSVSGTTIANRIVDVSGTISSADPGYVRASGFLNAGTVNVSNSGTALNITGNASGAVPVLTSNTYTWTNPVTGATSSVTDKALVAKAGVSLIGGSINYNAGTTASLTGNSTTSNVVGGNGAGFSNYNDSSTGTGSLNMTGVSGGQIFGNSTNGNGVFFLQTAGMNFTNSTATINATSTNGAAMTGAGISVSNTGSNTASLAITANGKTGGFSNGGGAGVQATGSNSTVNITGSATSGTGVTIQGFVRGISGGTVNISGSSTAGGEGINLLNGSTWCGTSDCGYGAIGGATSGNVTLTGTSATSNGVNLGGLIQSQSKISITGTTTASGAYGAYLPVVGINIASGGSANSGDAVTITGNNSAVAAAGTGHGVYLAAGKVGNNVITSSSNGGALTINSANSGITVASTASILNNSTAGAVTLSAGDNTASSAAIITAQAAALITQKGSGGVTVSTDGNGNVTAPGVINMGGGDITLSAGKLHAAGDATGGQVLTVSGNGAANLGGGKLKVYSGSSTSTGKLSYLASLFNTLYYNGSSNALNAQFNSAAGSSISGSSSTAQVLFREVPATYPSFTISLANLSKTYGDADPASLSSALQTAYTAGGGVTTLTKAVGNNTFGLAASDVISSLTGTRATGENVGTYAYNLSVGSGLNTSLTAQPNMVIGKRNITINTLTAQNRVYDADIDATITGATFNNIANGETLGLSGSGTFASKDVGTAKTVTVSDVTALTKSSGTGVWSNYNLTSTGSATTSANITPKDATVNGTATTVTYNGNTQNQSAATSSGFISGDTITISGAASGRNAGTYTSNLSVGGTDAGNYTVTVNNADLTINKANLTLQAVTDTKTYDGGTSSTATVATSGLRGSDSVSSLSQSYADKNASTNITLNVNGGYTINDGNSGNNYSVTTQSVNTGTITQKTLTASLQGSVSKEYDGTTAASIASSNVNLSGFVSGEGAAVNATSGIYASKNVVDNQGSGAVSVSLQPSSFTANSNTSLSNYTLPTSATGNVGTITPAALTVKVNDTAMFVTQDPNLAVNNGFSYTGFKNGETAGTALVGGAISNTARTYSGASNPVVGTYSNVYGLASSPVAVNGNYTVTVQNGKLQVVPAGQLLIAVSGQQKTYGSITPTNVGASAQTVTAQYLDTSGGSVISSLTMQNLGNGVWKATDNTNTAVTFNIGVNGAQASSGGYLNVGNYIYNSSNLQPTSTSNFTGSSTNGGVLTITPKALTAGTVSKVYDGVNTQSAATVAISGAMTGDVVSAKAATATYASRNVGAGQSVSLQGTSLSGTDAANYSIVDQNTTGNITKAALVLSAASDVKTYDGTTSSTASPIVVSGLVSGDTVSGLGQAFQSKNVLGQNGSTLLVSSYTVNDGNSGGNYTVTTNSTSGTINPKALLVSGTTVKNKYYDGTASASVVPGTLSGLIGTETLALAASGSFADVQVGQGKIVAVAYTLANGSNGGLAQNYYVGSSRAPVLASILPNADPVKPVNPIRPVDPVNPYTPVKPVKPPFFDPNGGKDHADDHISFDKREESKACSRLHPENCTCENTLVPSVQVCYVTPDVKIKKKENELRVSRLF